MKCYDKKEWENFFNGNISSKINDEMINHMSLCEDCSNLYLNFIEDNLLNTDDDFSDKVASNIRDIEKREQVKKVSRYIVAASITLLLYSVGVFDNMMFVPNKMSNGLSILNSSISKLNLKIDLNLNNIWRNNYEKE